MMSATDETTSTAEQPDRSWSGFLPHDCRGMRSNSAGRSVSKRASRRPFPILMPELDRVQPLVARVPYRPCLESVDECVLKLLGHPVDEEAYTVWNGWIAVVRALACSW
jgi:hypothetical protein